MAVTRNGRFNSAMLATGLNRSSMARVLAGGENSAPSASPCIMIVCCSVDALGRLKLYVAARIEPEMSQCEQRSDVVAGAGQCGHDGLVAQVLHAREPRPHEHGEWHAGDDSAIATMSPPPSRVLMIVAPKPSGTSPLMTAWSVRGPLEKCRSTSRPYSRNSPCSCAIQTGVSAPAAPRRPRAPRSALGARLGGRRCAVVPPGAGPWPPPHWAPWARWRPRPSAGRRGGRAAGRQG